MAHASPQGRPPPRPDARASASPSGTSPPPHPDLVAALRRIAACAAHPAERGLLLQTIVQEAASLGAASAAVATPTDDDLLRVGAGTGALAWLEGEFLPLGASFMGAAVRAGAPRGSARLGVDPDAYALEQELEVGAALALPLLHGAHVHGAILLGRAPGDSPFAPADVASLATIAEAAASVLAGADAYDRRRASRAAASRAAKGLAGWTERLPRLLQEAGMTFFQVDVAAGRMRWPFGAGECAGGDECSVHEWLQRVEAADRDRVARSLTAWEGGGQIRAVRMGDSGGAPLLFALHVYPGDAAAPGVRLGLLRREESEAPGLSSAELIRAMRHEINNPLAVVRGHAQLLERDPGVQAAEHLHTAVQQIGDACRRIAELTSRLAVAETHPDHAFVTAEGGLGVVPKADGAN